MDVFAIFNMLDFLQNFVISRKTEILMELNFCVGVYV